MKVLRYFIIIMLLIGFLIMPNTISADPANPDSITIESARIFSDVKEADDMLLQIAYNIDYTTEPENLASDLYQVWLMNAAGNAILGTIPMIRPVNYYQYNIISIYADAAEVTASIVWGTAYKVRLTGSESYFLTLTEDVNMDTYTLTAADWVTCTLGYKEIGSFGEYYSEWSLPIAKEMETDLGEDLTVIVAGYTFLNDIGKNYWVECTPGIDSLNPYLFQTSVQMPSITQPVPTSALQTANTMTNKLGSKLYNGFVGIGNYLGVPVAEPATAAKVAAGLFWLIVCATVAGIAFSNSGLALSGIILNIPFILIGVHSGFIEVALAFTVCMLILGVFAYYVFLRGM